MHDGIENNGIIPKPKLTMKSRSLEAAISGASKKMETEIVSLRTQLRGDKAKLEALTSKLHQLQQQTEIYTHECQVVREKIKDSNWAFTKETSQSLLKIKKPTPEILDLSEKFMMLIEQKETNWKMFQASVRNYDSLKALLDKFNPENIREENVDLILGLWKNYNAIQPKIAKTCRGASILLDWVTSCMEFKIKKATLESVKRSLLEVQNKIKDYNNNIAEKESLVVTLQEKLKELKENPPKEEVPKKMPLQNTTQSRANLPKENSDGELQTKKSKGKLNKLLSSQSVANMHSEAENKKAAAAAKADENDQGSMQNASCEVKLETAQVNAIFSSTYRFPTNFGSGLSFRHDDVMSSSRKNSNVEKIFKIIANHDDRNKDNAVLSDSKIFFVKERTVNNTPNPKSDGQYHEGHSIDIRQPLFEEDKTNSTYLNSMRNPILENSNLNQKKKVFSTVGTNSGASIGMNTLRHEELSHRTHVTKCVLTPREDIVDLADINMDNVSRRSKKNEEDSVKNEEEEIVDDDQSFAACCKKGINRFFCA